MNCMRCQGLMVPDHCFDFEGTSGFTWAESHRCMNCGYVHDAVIDRHRQTARILSTEPDYQDEEVHLGRESYIIRAA